MKRKSSFLATYERFSIIPLSMIALGIGLAFVAESLGAYWGGLAFVGALVLVFGGVLLLFLYFFVKVAVWFLQRVGTTTGLIVEEAEPPPPPEPVASGPSWRVTLPDGPHTVYLEDERLHASRLVCDGRFVEVTWPIAWRGSPKALFTISGHRATLVEAPDWRRTLRWYFGLGNLFGLGGGGPAVYRHDLHVDGASVERLDAVATPPSG